MNRVWMVAVAMAAAMAGRAESLRPQAHALVTVFTYDRAGVPWAVMARAQRVATAAFAAAGVEVRWVEGKRLGEPREATCDEMLTVAFDRTALANAVPGAMAVTRVGGGADADVHVFYNRVAGFEDRLHMPEFLGNVLAHELTHALQGVARHSNEGLMKSHWNARDYAAMVRSPLPFSAVDLDLLRAHFKPEVPGAQPRP